MHTSPTVLYTKKVVFERTNIFLLLYNKKSWFYYIIKYKYIDSRLIIWQQLKEILILK